jgi:arylsulfatase A-like enzyme
VAAAAEFTVTAIEAGQETPIFRSELDPGRRAAHRRWFEKRVPLAGFAGRRVRFRFASRRTGTRGETTLPLWGDPAVLAPRPGNAPPVVLISLDTLRAASVTSYGARRLTTPNLDRRMARAGAVFVNATAPYPNTLPSHMSMMTGLYPRTHGVQHIFATLAPEHPTLPERLRAAGYETAAFTEDGFIVPEAGFRRGVALYTENKGRGIQDVPGYAARTFARGMAWLERHADQPFFLFLHTYQVHFPYTPPPLYRSYFGERRTPAALGEYDRLAYEREVRYVDDEVGAFLERLDALGLAARTLVIVTADHGEEFFEHGQRLHNFQLYEESVRVPLFMRFSTRIPPGLRPEAPVSLVDIAPTILDLVGLPAVPRADGTSLVPLLERGPEAFSRRAVFAETISSLQSPMVDLIAVRTLQHKCIRHAATGVHECYDLLADPRERRPLAADEDTPEIAQARGLLEAFRTTARSEPVTTPGQIDPERERNLRALGYVD